MKKSTLCLSLCAFMLQAESPKFSQSFLFTRPGQQQLALRQSLWHNLLYDRTKDTAIETAVFYQKSNHAHDIGRYFLPPNREQLLVNSTALNRDVLPYWLDLPEDFSGNLSLAPEQSQVGFMIEGRYVIGKLFNTGKIFGMDVFQNWGLFGSIAFSSVKNNINLTQTDVINPGPITDPVNDIITAFNNPEWVFDKINGPTKKTNFSEIRIGLATTFLSSPRALVVAYSALSFPTGKKPSGEILFGAQNGYGHVGVVSGALLQIPLSRPNEEYRLSLAISLENIYLLRNHQYRSFDLYKKPWSRFMLMRKKDDPNNILIPGVNVLTHGLRVSPHNIIDFGTGMRLASSVVEGEVGFALWAHGGERAEFFDNGWVPEYGIAGSAVNKSASESTISFLAPDDPVFVTILESDLDLKSAVQVPNLVYKVYAAVNILTLKEKYDIDLGFGAFKEMPHNETDALGMWGIWFAGGTAF